MSILNMNRI